MMLAMLTVPSMLATITLTPALVHRSSHAAIRMAMPLVAEYSIVQEHEINMRALRDRMFVQSVADASKVIAQIELIDLKNELNQTHMSVDVLASQNAVLVREKDSLTTQLRHASPGYIGMPFAHSLANCVAHGRDAAVAARSDALWQIRRAVERVLNVRRAVAFQSQLFALRAGLRMKRKIDEVRRSCAQQKQRAHADVARATRACARAWLSAWAWTGLYGQMAKEAAQISGDMAAARRVAKVMARA